MEGKGRPKHARTESAGVDKSSLFPARFTSRTSDDKLEPVSIRDDSDLQANSAQSPIRFVIPPVCSECRKKNAKSSTTKIAVSQAKPDVAKTSLLEKEIDELQTTYNSLLERYSNMSQKRSKGDNIEEDYLVLIMILYKYHRKRRFHCKRRIRRYVPHLKRTSLH